MNTNLQDTILKITDTAAETKDYTGEDGLLYCGKCHKPKEAYSPEGKTFFGRDRHPTDCDCQRAAREKQQAAESRQKHLEKVEDLKRRGRSKSCTVWPSALNVTGLSLSHFSMSAHSSG